MLPIIKIDLRKKYADSLHQKFLSGIWDCEILTIRLNKRTARVRLYHPASKDLIAANFETSMDYFVPKTLEVTIHE